jgi:hypothetical protein
MPPQMNAMELSEFYHRIGAALWNLQYLEDALVSFLVMKMIHERRCSGQTITAGAAEVLLAEQRRLTLGPLIGSCKKHKIIRQNFEPRFEAFKLERHWLVHRSLIDSGDDLYDDAAREKVFNRVATLIEEADSLRAIVFADMKTWTVAHGVTMKAVEEHARTAIRKLKSKDER